MKARPMTVKLLLWLVKLAVDAAPADQSRLFSSRLVCSSIRIVPAGGNQMSPVVPVYGRVSYFSLRQCSGASHNDSWDVLQKQTFLPANTSSPYRWYTQGESVDMILLVAAKWVAKEAELPSFHLRWQRSGLRLTVYGLVGDMVMATDAQHNPKAVKLESVELVTQWFS